MNFEVIKSITDQVPLLTGTSQSTDTLMDKVGLIYGFKITGSKYPENIINQQ